MVPTEQPEVSEADVEKEAQILRARANGRLALLEYQIERVLIRTCRIALAGVVFFVAWYIGSTSRELIARPIGSLSLADLGRVVFFGLLMLGGIGWSLGIAFGPAPARKQESESDYLAKARELVLARRRGTMYSGKSKLLRVLDDPEMGLQGKPLLQVLLVLGVTIALCIAISLFARLVARAS